MLVLERHHCSLLHSSRHLLKSRHTQPYRGWPLSPVTVSSLCFVCAPPPPPRPPSLPSWVGVGSSGDTGWLPCHLSLRSLSCSLSLALFCFPDTSLHVRINSGHAGGGTGHVLMRTGWAGLAGSSVGLPASSGKASSFSLTQSKDSPLASVSSFCLSGEMQCERQPARLSLSALPCPSQSLEFRWPGSCSPGRTCEKWGTMTSVSLEGAQVENVIGHNKVWMDLSMISF